MADITHIPWFHYFANAGLRVIYAVVLKMDRKGLENVPREGPLIVAINHTSFLDPIVAGAYVRDDVQPMTKIEAFESPFRWIFTGYGAFPVRRGEGDLSALKVALKVLKAGHAMLISPEGTRTKSGVLREAHEGIALIALRSGAPILPVAMWGGKALWSNLSRLRRTPVALRVGEPLVIRGLKTKATREELREVTDEFMYHLAELLPPEYRGAYSNLDTYTPRYLVPQNTQESTPDQQPKREPLPMTN